MTDLLDIFGTAPATPATKATIQCPPPGVYYDVPAAEYHAWEAISSTVLKAYAANPATVRRPFIPGDDAAVGSGIHAYTLQGEAGLAEECFILPDECEGRSKKALDAREWYAEKNPGKAMLPPVYGPEKVPVIDVLKGVDASFRSHPKTGPILANSRKEVSLVWIDSGTGLTCKARLDVWDGRVIWDVKKCRDLDRFSFQIRDLFYGVQAGWYFVGAVACGLNPVAFGFLPCEAFPPYRVGCGYRDPDKLMEDCQEAQRLVGLLAESTITGNWPNFRPPPHIFSWKDLVPDDLMEVY